MHELKTTNKHSRNKKSRTVEYVPPSEKKIEKFAEDVCQKLNEQQEENYSDRETKQGLTEFMKLAVKLETALRNPGGYHGK